MAHFKDYEVGLFMEGKERVYDYAIFADVNVYDNDVYEYVFYGVHNDSDFYMSHDNKYGEAHNDYLINALANANRGIHTFAEIAITADDNWVCRLFTEEEIKTKISEEQYNMFMRTFQGYSENNMKCQEKHDKIQNEINRLKSLRDEWDSATLVQQIGDWVQEVRIYGGDIDKYVAIMEKDAKRYRCHYPYSNFTGEP
jgi:hypothetical protein